MIADVIREANSRMKGAITSLESDLGAFRTGRASTKLVEHLKVEQYGMEMQLNQMASISVPEPQQLAIRPYDRSSLSAIEKAIMKSDLGLNPATAGSVIRVPLPALTEERRRDLTKVVRHEGENARIAIRNVRRDVMQELKEMLKEKLVSEDDDRRAQEEVQKLTDKYVAEVDVVLAEKEKDLMQV